MCDPYCEAPGDKHRTNSEVLVWEWGTIPVGEMLNRDGTLHDPALADLVVGDLNARHPVVLALNEFREIVIKGRFPGRRYLLARALCAVLRFAGLPVKIQREDD